MSTDLVERLRHMADGDGRHEYAIGHYWNAVDEAAAEIERLRAEIERWRAGCRQIEMAEAEAMALVLQHEAVIERLQAEIERLRARDWTPADGFWLVTKDGRSKTKISDAPLTGVALDLAPFLDDIARALCDQRDTPMNSAYDLALAVLRTLDGVTKNTDEHRADGPPR